MKDEKEKKTKKNEEEDKEKPRERNILFSLEGCKEGRRRFVLITRQGVFNLYGSNAWTM
jgi:hypothetical protein